uniref:RxLR effector candidate protein n=1 Tax=Peronospora matthiolae TaxID=2874970 RepID=A0AAV1UCB8_9STRA
MRLHPFVFLAVTAAPARATGPATVSNSSLTKKNITASDPLFVNGTKDAPADQHVRAQENKSAEERLPTPEIAEVVPVSLNENMKAIISKLHGTTDKHGSIPAQWSLLSTRDEKVFEHVYSETLLDFRETDLDVLSAMLVTYETEYQNVMVNKFKEWMNDQNPEDLVKVLTKNDFFEDFHCAKVQALEQFLVELNAEKGTTHTLVGTISEGLGGEDKLAYMLSLARLSPFTKNAATSIQHKLLSRWKEQGKPIEGVVELLGLSPQKDQTVRLTYEQLNTLVEYGKLLLEEEPVHEALFFVVRYLRKTFGDDVIVQAITDGLEHVQSVRAYLREKYGVKSNKLEGVSDTETQQYGGSPSDLERMLYAQLKMVKKTPETSDGSPSELSEIQAKHL